MCLKGPYRFSDFLDSGKYIGALPDKPGVYRILIKENYNVDKHGPSRVIYIGSAGSILKRVGQFLATSMGCGVWHSAGDTFAKARERLSLTIRDLEYEFTEADDFREMEAMLFNEFESKVKSESNYERLKRVRKEINSKADLLYPILCNARPRNVIARARGC